MPKRALYEKRPYLLASFAAALAFYYLRAGPVPELYLIPVKGAAVGLLALYAFMRHHSPDSRLLVWVMALAAVGDMAFEVDSETAAWLYFGSHLFALGLYLRNRRPVLSTSQKACAASLLLLLPAICAVLALPGSRFSAALYGLTMGAMAATAWTSVFPRYRVGAGAVLYVAAELLLLAGLGIMQGSMIPQIFAWPLYYLGQFLICTGVIQTLRKRDPELRLIHGR
ncbi:lysoplasmalogenase family protein [Altericroceibacterium endophyticum]|uniref:Lysoplasmalogenase n=1 Tax=Altericroceibacterium endophyticum TaxID=1808508 RepID=A0A6I4T2H0_9SPHN|nr:lysoplasmalogenase family protein [Altericroceibacterium endophyticum]MXO64421.1 lysoplasmalogenase [Altericroceibacterium endophyticum]